jgi:hypothetical protein
MSRDATSYVTIQREWWGAHWTFPFLPLGRDLVGLRHGFIPAPDQLLRLFSSFGILTMMLLYWRKFDRSFLAYLIIAFLFIHSQEPHSRTARYELVLFPIPALLAQAMGVRPVLARSRSFHFDPGSVRFDSGNIRNRDVIRIHRSEQERRSYLLPFRPVSNERGLSALGNHKRSEDHIRRDL